MSDSFPDGSRALGPFKLQPRFILKLSRARTQHILRPASLAIQGHLRFHLRIQSFATAPSLLFSLSVMEGSRVEKTGTAQMRVERVFPTTLAQGARCPSPLLLAMVPVKTDAFLPA
ncbi:hypothetical protein AB1N83_009549 [Pleurotus pulmonarius]